MHQQIATGFYCKHVSTGFYCKQISVSSFSNYGNYTV